MRLDDLNAALDFLADDLPLGARVRQFLEANNSNAHPVQVEEITRALLERCPDNPWYSGRL